MSGQFACRRGLGYAALRARNLIERAAAHALCLPLRSAPRNPARSFHCESLEPRNLFSGSISGTLWQDTNASQTRDAGEPTLANWGVYLDANRNRIRDAAEAFTTTSAAGT